MRNGHHRTVHELPAGVVLRAANLNILIAGGNHTLNNSPLDKPEFVLRMEIKRELSGKGQLQKR